MMKTIATALLVLMAGCQTQPLAESPTAPVNAALNQPPMPPVASLVIGSNVVTVARTAPAFAMSIPPEGHSLILTVDWDQDYDNDGTGILYGNARGVYPYRTNIDSSAWQVTLSNLDDRLPWFFNAVGYLYLDTPQVVTNTRATALGTIQITHTNYLIDSEQSGELEFATSNMRQWVQVTGTNAFLQFWGDSNQLYSVIATDLASPFVHVADVMGTNGPMDFSEPLQTNGARFYGIIGE